MSARARVRINYIFAIIISTEEIQIQRQQHARTQITVYLKRDAAAAAAHNYPIGQMLNICRRHMVETHRVAPLCGRVCVCLLSSIARHFVLFGLLVSMAHRNGSVCVRAHVCCLHVNPHKIRAAPNMLRPDDFGGADDNDGYGYGCVCVLVCENTFSAARLQCKALMHPPATGPAYEQICILVRRTLKAMNWVCSHTYERDEPAVEPSPVVVVVVVACACVCVRIDRSHCCCHQRRTTVPNSGMETRESVNTNNMHAAPHGIA